MVFLLTELEIEWLARGRPAAPPKLIYAPTDELTRRHRSVCANTVVYPTRKEESQ